MVFFPNLRRSRSEAPNGHNVQASQAGVPYYSAHTAPRSVLRRTDKPLSSKQHASHASSDSLPSPPSDVTLPPVYTDLDFDTSRYPNPVASRSRHPSQPRPRVPSFQSSRSYGHKKDVTEPVHHYPHTNASQSPVMTSVLAAGSVTIIWDVRQSPIHMRQPRQSRQTNDLSVPATSTFSERICLIAHEFPWSIDVAATQSRPLTALDIVEAIYESLTRELRRSEWALASDSQKYSMQKANRVRRQADTAKRMRRVDWLGTRTMFRGLEKDDNLARKRLMPGDRTDIQTWVIRFGSQ